MSGWVVSTGRKSTETELKLSEAIGMKNKDGLYLHQEEVLTGRPFSTVFTQAPYFSTDARWIPYLKQLAKEKYGLTLSESSDPEQVAKEFLNKLS